MMMIVIITARVSVSNKINEKSYLQKIFNNNSNKKKSIMMMMMVIAIYMYHYLYLYTLYYISLGDGFFVGE